MGKTTTSQIETELIEQAKLGNGKAFELLIKLRKRHIRYIVHGFFGSSEEGKDILVEITAKVYFNLHKYKPCYKFSTWSNNLAKNYCIDEYRKKKFKIKIVDVAYEVVSFSNGLNIEDQIIKGEESNQIRYMLTLLPKRLYNPVYLFYFEDKKYHEIATELSIPIGTVSNYICNGMKALRKLYAQNVN